MCLIKIGFSHTGRAHDDDILLLILDPVRSIPLLLLVSAHVLGVVVMITHGNGEGLFSLVLADHKAIQVRFDIARLVIEIKNLIGPLHLGEGPSGSLLLRWQQVISLPVTKTGHRHGGAHAHLAKHVLEHLLQLIRVREILVFFVTH